jgi:hypothetical protein
MRKMFLLVTIVLLGAAFAQADVIWDFNYTSVTPGYSASGTFTTGCCGSPYTVTGITGTADTFAITGPVSYAGQDQLLYVPQFNGSYADFAGISFANANGVDYNITNLASGNWINISTLDPGGNGSAAVAVDMTVTRVPEPTIPALLGMGLVGFGIIRRKLSV